MITYCTEITRVPCAQYTKRSTRCIDLHVSSPPVTVQDILPPCHKKNELTLDNLCGKCLMIVPVFFTATAYRS